MQRQSTGESSEHTDHCLSFCVLSDLIEWCARFVWTIALWAYIHIMLLPCVEAFTISYYIIAVSMLIVCLADMFGQSPEPKKCQSLYKNDLLAETNLFTLKGLGLLDQILVWCAADCRVRFTNFRSTCAQVADHKVRAAYRARHLCGYARVSSVQHGAFDV